MRNRHVDSIAIAIAFSLSACIITRNEAQRIEIKAANPLKLCVLLPVHKDAATLPLAWASLQAQTMRDWRCYMLLNGADEASARVAAEIARSDQRVELVQLPQAGLASALNRGLALAAAKGMTHAARMDADDWSFPQRFALQTAFWSSTAGATQTSNTSASKGVVALGTSWEVWDHAMHKQVGVVSPPTSPDEARWKLLLGNTFAHGSMMLDIKRVLEAGGYDDTMTKAQDYELWLRLSRRRGAVCSLPEVLYRHRSKGPQGGDAVREQARFATQAKLKAWSLLPFDDGAELPELLVMQQAGEVSLQAARERVAQLLTRQGPTREALMAYLALGAQEAAVLQSKAAMDASVQGSQRSGQAGSGQAALAVAASIKGGASVPSSPQAVAKSEPQQVPADPEQAFALALAEHTRKLARIMPGKVYLYPGGRIARRCVAELGLDATVIAGIVDDVPARASEALSKLAPSLPHRPRVIAPSELPSEAVVVLGTYAHADALWDASVFMRARGILVERVEFDHPALHAVQT